MALASAGLLLAAAAPAAAKPPAPVEAITRVDVGVDLAGPLHLAIDPAGRLYVADAFAEQLVRVDLGKGGGEVVASGLGFAPGVGVRGGQVYVVRTVGGGGPETPPEAAELVRIKRNGSLAVMADLLAYERENNPDQQDPNGPDAQTNPYDVLPLPGRVLVADAAANAVLEVSANGDISTLTVLPVSTAGACAEVPNNNATGRGCDPVPTDLALAPDGTVYVSGLGGEVEGRIWQIDPRTGEILREISGLPPLTGVAVGDDGSVYASSLFAGTVTRIAPDGSRSSIELPGPTDVDIYRGVLYVATGLFGPGAVYAVPVAEFDTP